MVAIVEMKTDRHAYTLSKQIREAQLLLINFFLRGKVPMTLTVWGLSFVSMSLDAQWIEAQEHWHYYTIQTWKTSSFNEKRDLVRSCPLLQSVSPSVLTKLAEAVTWETVRANQSKPQNISKLVKLHSLPRSLCFTTKLFAVNCTHASYH